VGTDGVKRGKRVKKRAPSKRKAWKDKTVYTGDRSPTSGHREGTEILTPACKSVNFFVKKGLAENKTEKKKKKIKTDQGTHPTVLAPGRNGS